MADIEQQIAAWRSRLSALVGGNRDLVAELEVHLRDAVQDQVRRGVPDEQALAIALARLGSPEALAREFAKQSGRIPWLPARLIMGLGTLAAAGLTILLAQRVWSGAATLLLALHQGAVTLGYSAVFLVGGLASCYLLARPFRELQPGQARFVLRCAWLILGGGLFLTAAGIVLGGVWASDHLGRFWGWDAKEIGGLCVLVWEGLMLLVLSRRAANLLPGMVVAMVGNVVVLLAWFGVALVFPKGHNGYAEGPIMVLALVVACHLAIGALSLVPAGRLGGG
jgi:cytochrome c assembly protein